MTSRFVIDARDPLAHDWAPDLSADPVAWSGSLSDDLFEPHPHNWLPPGRAALDALCARVRPALEAADRTLVFRPHARHILSEVPSCRAFLQDHAREPFGIALSPADMLEPSMLDRVEEHLERFVAGLGGLCTCILRADVAVAGDDCVLRPAGEGILPLSLLDDLLAQHAPGMPVLDIG